MPLYSTSISDRKRRKPHFYDSRLFIYIFGFFFLTSGWFWTFSYFFCALCPFSPAQLRISLWLSDDFGLFYTFSVLYVHFLLFSSVFLSGFRMILDFFPIFLSFMSIWKSTEVSGLRWIQKSQDCEEYRNLQTAKSTEVSKLRWVQKPPTCDEFRSLQTAMSSEASNLRRVQKSPNYDEHGSLQPA